MNTFANKNIQLQTNPNFHHFYTESTLPSTKPNHFLTKNYVRRIQKHSPLKFNQTEKFNQVRNKRMKNSQNTTTSMENHLLQDKIVLKKNSNSVNFNGIREKQSKNNVTKPTLQDLDIRSIESIQDEQERFRQMEQSIIICEYSKQSNSRLQALYMAQKKQKLSKKISGMCNSRTNSTESIQKVQKHY